VHSFRIPDYEMELTLFSIFRYPTQSNQASTNSSRREHRSNGMNTVKIKYFAELFDEDLELIGSAVVIRSAHIEALYDKPRIKELRKGGHQKSCGKEKYRDLDQAKEALWYARVAQAKALREGHLSHRRECRYYFHVGCHAWHLTSKPDKTSKAIYELAS